MTFLFDTHALIWFAENDPRLSKRARSALENPDNAVFYSSATIWEMAIKMQLGKLEMSLDLAQNFRRLLEENGIQSLSIEYEHAAGVVSLPLHHRDPFDRMLIAQARVEQMIIVSHDQQFDPYAVQRLW